ncbi:MAG: UDP-3-O-(3-hydroxymyristoyl)glucosamine N-acyltransferase, partial [Alistipes sp.]|nr:UDP-3-O-(3-hydroxymyristoyl)glucosamine N-acyltransferase [Candidatus Minthomonas equi]
APTGIAGSAHVGSGCMIGGQVGISGHTTVGDNARIAAQSGTMKDVEPGTSVMGSPAFDYKTFLRAYAIFRRNGRNSNK